MNSRLETFFREISKKRVAVLGVGVTNAPLAELLISKGCEVTVCDRRDMNALGEYGERLAALGAKFKLGEDYLQNIEADVIFRTPGMKYYLPELCEYRKRGVEVTSEMEVFFELCPSHIIAITGSNGKTTTSTVISEILKASGKTVWLGGNIGKALLPDIEKMERDHYIVCELSSFQLISMRRSPEIAVITNISENHLDMHKDMQEYIDAKRNIYWHQQSGGKLIVNADCPIVSRFADEARGCAVTFSRTAKPEWGAYLDGEDICFNRFSETRRVMSIHDIKIPGMHNVENYMTAICACEGLASDEDIIGVARTFCGVAHRAQFVREHKGVRWYNDSIATTPSRVEAGMLKIFDQKIILIAGGYDKLIPFDDFGPAVCEKVSSIILMGDTADKIETAVRNAENFESSGIAIYRVANMQEAVAAADRIAKEGDIVALSPACASFDMYSHFDERGDHFCSLVNELK